MRAVIVGAVESTRIALRSVAAAPGWEVAALITLPPELAARHSDFVDMGAEARDAGARLVLTPNSNAPEVLDAMSALAPDYVFVIGWSQICKPEFRQAAGGRVIGYHPAPLPRLRGRAVIPWTILLDEKITASTLFWIDDGVDTGPILAQQFFHIAPDETAASLYARHMETLGEILSASLPLLERENAPMIVQDDRFATWAARRTPADGLIDWSRPAAEIWRLIRAVGSPYPGAFTYVGDVQLTVLRAEPSPDARRHAAIPGQIIAVADGAFIVACGGGEALRVTDYLSPSERAPRLHSHLGRKHSA